MLNFVRKAFRGGLEVILWINLIAWIIGGGVAGNFLGGYYDDYTVLGIFCGIIVGIVSNIMMGGFIATILNIDKNLEEQTVLLRDFPAPNDWVCAKCGKSNRKTSLFSTGCGAKGEER